MTPSWLRWRGGWIVSSRISMVECTPASSTFSRTPRYADPHPAGKNGPQNKENGILRNLVNELIEVFDVIFGGLDGSSLALSPCEGLILKMWHLLMKKLDFF
jgi:hypothetical protein